MPGLALQKELDYFESKRHEWMRHGLEGKWALVHGDTLLGHYDSAEAAYERGVEVVGVSLSFLVKEVREQDRLLWNPTLDLGVLRVDR